MSKSSHLGYLQSVDPFVDSILIYSNYASLISYDKEKETWIRRAVDGFFFVYKRLDEPYYACSIINKIYTQNYFIRPIVKNLRFLQETTYIHVFEPDGRYFLYFNTKTCL